MIAGALNFTLGLQANQFLNTLGASSGKLLGLLGVANSIGMAFHKMWDAIEEGGRLTDMAAAASLTVKQLYQLEQAFKAVGASADSVPSIINKLRRTIASGEQNGLIAQLGLDPAQLAAMDPAAQFEKVAAAIAKINVNSRAGAAQALFGREGAQTIQQIANSGTEFSESMARAAKDAQTWQNVAGTFDMIADKITEIQAHIKTVWANLAGALIQAFNEGKLTETITDIIVTAFSAGLSVVPALFVKLGEVLLKVFQTPLAYLQAGIEFAIDQAVNNPKIRKLLQLTPAGMIGVAALDAAGVTSGKASSFEDILKERLAEGFKFNLGSGEFGMDEISASANDFLRESMAGAVEMFSGLNDRLSGLSSKLAGTSGGGSAGAGSELNFGSSKAHRPDVTSLEKIGFVFNGKGTIGQDHARATADNTRKANELLKITNQILTDIAPALKLVNINI